MSVLGYLGKSSGMPLVRVPRSEVEAAVLPVLEALRGRLEIAGPETSYKDVGDYDLVLKGHCRL